MSQSYNPSQNQLQHINLHGKVTFYLLQQTTRVGHHARNNIVIETPQIALFQAIITQVEAGYQFINLTNNIAVLHNDQPIPPNTPIILNQHDIIQLAGDTLVVHLADPEKIKQSRAPTQLLSTSPVPPSPPTTSFTLSEAIPKRQALWWPQRTGKIKVTITNNTAHPSQLGIQAQDEKDQCFFEFGLPNEASRLAGQAEFWLQPYQTIPIIVYATPFVHPFISLKRTSHYRCIVMVTMLSEDNISQSVSSDLRQHPLIGPGLLSLFLCIGLMMITLLINTLVTQMSTPSGPIFYQPSPHQEKIELSSADWKATAIARHTEEIAQQFHGQSYQHLFKEMAHIAGMEWQLLAELAYRESRLNPLALGPDNQIGLMQLSLEVWQERATLVGQIDPFEPYANLLVTADYLATLRTMCAEAGYQEEHWVLAAYKLGPDYLKPIFANGGNWADLPTRERRYILDILSAALALQGGPGQQYSRSTVLYQSTDIPEQTPYWWLKVGQPLPSSSLEDIYHRVRAEETVEDITGLYSVTQQAIFDYPGNEVSLFNPILTEGQWLIIPQGVIPTMRYTPSGEEVPLDALIGSGVFIWPMAQDITQNYSGQHPALDLRGKLGTTVVAADSGYVITAGWGGPYGNNIIIDHGNGFQTRYAHLAFIGVSAGDNVIKGQTIGQVGSTGNSSGPHLHLEIKHGDILVNPLSYLP